tara:strand:- start:213 stop:818 length:606 start_codon:yes stop_codon:yes gene_type:complete
MVFKRRKSLPIARKVREWLFPEKGWSRAAEYMMARIKRLPDSPKNISFGVAIGVFVSFSPFFGVHVLLAFLIARSLRVNILAAVLGTFMGNPITFPIIAALNFKIGELFINVKTEEASSKTFLQQLVDVSYAFYGNVGVMMRGESTDFSAILEFFYGIFLPYLVGGFILGVASGVVSYFIMLPIIVTYKARKARKKLKRNK